MRVNMDLRRAGGRVHNPGEMIEIVFVCTGNTCRSPMAEGLLRKAIPPSWKEEAMVSSAGTHAWDGQPASALAVRVLEEMEIDISGHSARLVSPEIINKASLIVAMTRDHGDILKEMVPGAGEWTIVLGELDGSRKDPDIHDPIGGDLEIYRAVRDDIEGLMGLLLEHMAGRFDLGGVDAGE
jgi:protein-tyrosine-phosphatase